MCNGQSSTSSFNHLTVEPGSPETCPDQINGVTSKEPALLRELDAELLQSGKLQLTGDLLSFCPSCLYCISPKQACDTETGQQFTWNYRHFISTGTVDRLGRALVFTDAGASEEGFCSEEVARVLSCYHRITR